MKWQQFIERENVSVNIMQYWRQELILGEVGEHKPSHLVTFLEGNGGWSISNGGWSIPTRQTKTAPSERIGCFGAAGKWVHTNEESQYLKYRLGRETLLHAEHRHTLQGNPKLTKAQACNSSGGFSSQHGVVLCAELKIYLTESFCRGANGCWMFVVSSICL